MGGDQSTAASPETQVTRASPAAGAAPTGLERADRRHDMARWAPWGSLVTKDSIDLGIVVRDIEAALRFYPRHLGLHRRRRFADARWGAHAPSDVRHVDDQADHDRPCARGQRTEGRHRRGQRLPLLDNLRRRRNCGRGHLPRRRLHGCSSRAASCSRASPSASSRIRTVTGSSSSRPADVTRRRGGNGRPDRRRPFPVPLVSGCAASRGCP